MLSVVLWFVFRDQVVQCSQHVWVESVEVALNGARQNSSLVVHQMREIDVEGGELKLAETVDLRNVVFVRGDST